MIKLFQRRRKAAGAAEPPPEKKSGKRTYVRLLEFRCRGRLLNSVKTDSLGSVVRIGRAADNDWVVPPQDRVCADYQAELRLGSREMRLQACSGQSIHYRGKAVSSCVLKGNDRVAIGDCELFVKPAELHEARPCDVHRLEFLNGPPRGRAGPAGEGADPDRVRPGERYRYRRGCRLPFPCGNPHRGERGVVDPRSQQPQRHLCQRLQTGAAGTDADGFRRDLRRLYRPEVSGPQRAAHPFADRAEDSDHGGGPFW